MPELAHAIKRTSLAILERGGIIKTFENVGQRDLPYKMKHQGQLYSKGHYLLANFDSNPAELVPMRKKLREEPDIIRTRILRKEEEIIRPCEKGPCDFGEMSEEMRKKLAIQLRECVTKL